MKILFDECVDMRLCKFLRNRGLDAIHVKETGWKGKSNGELYKIARDTFQMFISTDSDFSDPDRHPPTKTLGIIFIDIFPAIAPEIVPALEGLLAHHTLDMLIGKHTTLRHDGFEIH